MKTELSHEHISGLLPWYVKGTLSSEERNATDEHLKACNLCQNELQWLQNLNVAVSDLVEETPAAPEAHASFAKLLSAVDSAEAPRPSARQSWLARWIDTIWNPSVPIARLVFAAQLALILVLGVYSWPSRQTEPVLRTLSGTEGTSSGARLTVSFAPDKTVVQVNQTLLEINARIVSGPSASSIYVVELPISPEKDAEIQAVIEKLRLNEVIRFVERQP